MYSRGLIAGLVVLVVCSLIFSSAWSWTSSSAFYRSARHKRKTVRQHSTLSFIGTGGSNDIEIITSSSNGKMGQPIDQLYSNIPPPLNNLVDINMERSSVVYEVNLNRDIGFEIVQGFDYAVVGQVNFPFILLRFNIIIDSNFNPLKSGLNK